MVGEIRNASIQQINIAYNAIEDRLLLKIGFSDNAELAVWLTRRLVKGLWQLLQSDELMPHPTAAQSPNADKSLSGLEKVNATQKLDFTSEYKHREAINHNDILLAKDCHILKSVNQAASLELICANGQTIKLALTQELALALINMLQLVSKETGWELLLSNHAPVMVSLQTSSALH